LGENLGGAGFPNRQRPPTAKPYFKEHARARVRPILASLDGNANRFIHFKIFLVDIQRDARRFLDVFSESTDRAGKIGERDRPGRGAARLAPHISRPRGTLIVGAIVSTVRPCMEDRQTKMCLAGRQTRRARRKRSQESTGLQFHQTSLNPQSMSSRALAVIQEFNSLPQAEQMAAYEAIARKVTPADYRPLSDEDLTTIAAETFALLDQAESHAQSP
jgi:hypothetical protein